jgi:hypothetical protein
MRRLSPTPRADSLCVSGAPPALFRPPSGAQPGTHPKPTRSSLLARPTCCSAWASSGERPRVRHVGAGCAGHAPDARRRSGLCTRPSLSSRAALFRHATRPVIDRLDGMLREIASDIRMGTRPASVAQVATLRAEICKIHQLARVWSSTPGHRAAGKLPTDLRRVRRVNRDFRVRVFSKTSLLRPRPQREAAGRARRRDEAEVVGVVAET